MNSKELKNLMESYISIYESHFKVGDKVICKDSGMEGKVIKLDDKEVGKYYTVKREDGKEVKYAPDELKEKNGGASKDKEMKFHSKLDKLVHKTFGKSPEEQKEEFDIFDVILEFLVAEGYADTNQEALLMMTNVLDEEAINIILGEEKKLYPAEKVARKQEAVKRKEDIALHQRRDDDANKLYKRGVALSLKKKMSDIGYKKEEYVDEAQAARENPEKYEAGEKKKYAPVRGERTPMPPRGDKRREDFEKWYSANVR
jgi:preprotein translocase subunit YajC